MATTTARKTVSYKSPYIGSTFQGLTELLVGRDGYMSGAACEDDGVTITLPAFVFVQFGIVAEADEVEITIPAALLSGGNLIEPAFVIATVTDDNPASGVVATVTGSLESAANGVVVAFKAGGAWQNPVPVHMPGPFMLAAEVGLEAGGVAREIQTGGYVSDINLERGRLVDADGVRRTLSKAAASTAQAFNLNPTRPDGAFPRTDYVVRRKVDNNLSEIVHLQGPVRGGDSAISLQTGANITRPHYYGVRGGTYNEQWYAWGHGANLRIQGGPAGGGFAAATLLVAGNNITYTQIIGQRASDDAVILIYIAVGDGLMMTSFHPSSGALIDAAVSLEAAAGKSYLRGVKALDDETVHLVYRQGGEIFYSRFSFEVATFGTAAIAPNYALGVAEGMSSLYPDIALDRYGRPHLCWIGGATGTENLKYVQLNTDGSLISQQTFLPATAVGVTPNDVLLAVENGESGFTAAAFDTFTGSNITVTPQDEVYIALLGEATAESPLTNHALLYSPTFEASTGFPILSWSTGNDMNAAGLLSTGSGPLRSTSIVAGELGQLYICIIALNGANTRHLLFTFNPQPFRNGKFERRDLLLAENPVTVTDAGGFDDIIIERGQRGDVVMCSRSGTGGAITSRAIRRGGLRPATLIVDAIVFAYQLELHPQDVPLLQWEVGADPDVLTETDAGAPIGDDGVYELFHTRPKRMNYPFLVGDRGDYRGFNSLREALQIARDNGGGHVVVRSGSHIIPTAAAAPDYFLVGGGVSLIGEDNALLDFTSNVGLLSSGGVRITTGHSLTGNVLEIDRDELINEFGYIPRVGDMVDLADGGSGYHVLRALLSSPSLLKIPGSTLRFLLDDNAGGAPALGGASYLLSVGTRIENLTIRAELAHASHFHLLAANLYMPTIRNIRIVGSMTAPATGAAVYINACVHPVVENVDLRELDCDAALFAFRVGGNGEYSGHGHGIFRGIRVVDGQGVIRVLSSADRPHFYDSGGDSTDDTQTVWDIQAGRTTPIFMTNCTGLGAGDTEFIFTGVGKTLRVPEGFGGIAFEDDNTRGAGIPDDAIKLSSTGADATFNGVSEDVITTAVNERVLKAGDTLAGEFELRSPVHYAGLGLQQKIDQFGHLTKLGYYWSDDFHRNPTIAGAGWDDNNNGGGTSTWANPHHFALFSNVGVGARGSRYTTHAVVGAWNVCKPVWRCRAAVENGPDTGNRVEFGIITLAYPGIGAPIAVFRQAEAFANDNFWLQVTDDVSGLNEFDTGFEPVDNTYYWFTIYYVSDTEVGWIISSDAAGDTVLASGVEEVAAGQIVTTVEAGVFFNAQQGGGGAACTVYADFVESWSTARGAL